MEKIKENKERIFIYVSFIIYAIVSFISVIFHESWADEAQAWSIAKDLNFFEIIKQMKYEGHSCMWHLILLPFAKLGFPYETIKFISWFFCLMAVYIILKKSPFNKITKLLIIFNPSMTYLLPAVSRPYCMIPLFISCLCAVYPNKDKKSNLYAMLLALLANTHLIMIPMVGMLILDFWGEKLVLKRKEISLEERKKLIISFLIAIFGLMFFIIPILPSMTECKLVDRVGLSQNLKNFETFYKALEFTLMNEAMMLMGNRNISFYLIILILFLLLIASFYNKRQALIFWPQFIFFIILHTVIWFLNIQRAYMIIYMLMFWIWNISYKEKYETRKNNINIINKVLKNIAYVSFIILLIITFFNYRMYTKDIFEKNSNSKVVANYIKNYLPEGSIFLCVTDEAVSPVIPYLDTDKYHFYSLTNKNYYTFVTWNENWSKGIKKEDIIEAIDYFKYKEKIYILAIKDLSEVLEFNQYEKIYETTESVIWDIYGGTNEEYEIYKIN